MFASSISPHAILGRIIGPMTARRLWILCALVSTSCVTRAPSNFRVIPAAPNYLLRYPDARQTPFPDVLRLYNGFQPGGGWMDLRPAMELRIENAYYRPGMPRRGLDGFLGTETALYRVRSHRGLQLVSIQPMKDRPGEDPPVQELIQPSQQRRPYYRFYYEILFRRSGSSRGSVLLGANSKEELDHLATALLNDPDSVCRDRSMQCTVFPDACSVSIQMEIVINGTPRDVIWNSPISSIVDHPSHLELWRLYNGRLTPVNLNINDPNALRLPLLPADHVNWN